jgi:hypothetical protein
MLGGGWDIQTLNCIMAETNNGKCFFYGGRIMVRISNNSIVEYEEIGKIFTKVSKGDYNI